MIWKLIAKVAGDAYHREAMAALDAPPLYSVLEKAKEKADGVALEIAVPKQEASAQEQV